MLTSSPLPATAAKAGLSLRWMPAMMSHGTGSCQQQHSATCQVVDYATCWGGVGAEGLEAASWTHLRLLNDNSGSKVKPLPVKSSLERFGSGSAILLLHCCPVQLLLGLAMRSNEGQAPASRKHFEWVDSALVNS